MMAAVLAGCATMQAPVSTVRLEFRAGSLSPQPGLTKMTPAGSDKSVYISDEVALSNADVRSVRVKTGEHGPQIEIVFTEAGAERFAATTERLIGMPLGIVVDGLLISAPLVMDMITGGRAVITGGFSAEEAERIANGITGE